MAVGLAVGVAVGLAVVGVAVGLAVGARVGAAVILIEVTEARAPAVRLNVVPFASSNDTNPPVSTLLVSSDSRASASSAVAVSTFVTTRKLVPLLTAASTVGEDVGAPVGAVAPVGAPVGAGAPLGAVVGTVVGTVVGFFRVAPKLILLGLEWLTGVAVLLACTRSLYAVPGCKSVICLDVVPPWMPKICIHAAELDAFL
jgi:hypothetical protein